MKKLVLKSCFFTALLLLSVYVRAQSVKGKVVDATTGNPIPNASIHLNGSSKGTTSNRLGDFVLYTDETKKPLVVSSVGYQSETIDNYNNKTLNVKLSPRTQALREVVIGESMTRDKQMKIFITQFIGSSKKDCIITNPDDINFTYHKKTQTLEANVNQPLIIHNKKLGYKITYFLSAFSYSPKAAQYPDETFYHMETSYKGNYVFEEDTLFLKHAEIKKIRKARDNAYYGSRMHFIRSVLAGMNWDKSWVNDLEKTKFDYAFSNIDSNYKGYKFNFVVNNTKANKEQILNNIIVHTDEKWYTGRPVAFITYDAFEHSRVIVESGEILFKRRADAVPLTPIVITKVT